MRVIMDESRALMFNGIHVGSETHWQKKAAKEAARARERAADRDELEFHLSALEVAGDLLLGVFGVASFTLLMAVL